MAKQVINIKWNSPRKDYEVVDRDKFNKLPVTIKRSVTTQLNNARDLTRQGLMDPASVIEV